VRLLDFKNAAIKVIHDMERTTPWHLPRRGRAFQHGPTQEFDQGHDFVYSVQIKNTAVGQNVLTN